MPTQSTPVSYPATCACILSIMHSCNIDGVVGFAYRQAETDMQTAACSGCLILTKLATNMDLLFTRAWCACVLPCRQAVEAGKTAACSNVTHWVSSVSHTHISCYRCDCAVYQNKVHVCHLTQADCRSCTQLPTEM